MAVMATWRDMKWELSQNVINRLESLSTSFEMKKEENSDKQGNSPTQQVAINDIAISLTTTYRVETGTKNIKAMISKWKSLIGKAGPLIIGSEIFGPEQVQLQSVGVSNIHIRADGVFTAVTLDFKFVEYRQTAVITENKRNTSSALNVGASQKDKADKCTYPLSFTK